MCPWHSTHEPCLTFFGRQNPGTCSPLLSFPMSRISLCSSSISASWLPASSFCRKPRKSREAKSTKYSLHKTAPKYYNTEKGVGERINKIDHKLINVEVR